MATDRRGQGNLQGSHTGFVLFPRPLPSVGLLHHAVFTVMLFASPVTVDMFSVMLFVPQVTVDMFYVTSLFSQ